MSQETGSSCAEPIIKSLPPTETCTLIFVWLIRGTLFFRYFPRNNQQQKIERCGVLEMRFSSAIIKLAISEACVILGALIVGTLRNLLRKLVGKPGRISGVARQQEEKRRVPDKIHRRAAKVERAACAIGDAIRVSGFHLCMYSADTLHPSPQLHYYYNDL